MLNLTRLPDWEPRLAAFIARKQGVLFTWGATDCCAFAGDAVEAITGTDPMPEFRGRYSTATGALRALRRYGVGTIAATVDGKFPVVPRAFAQRGDLVAVPAAAGDVMVGVCVGAAALFVGLEIGPDGDAPGLVSFPRAAWSRAWRVG